MSRPAPTILAKLLLAYVTPALAVFALLGWFAYDLLRRDLDGELGTRLTAVAALTATRLKAEYLLAMDPGEDPAPAAYTVARKELLASAVAARVHRIYVFTPAHTSLADTRADIAIGHRYHELELDRHELARVFAGEPTATVLFQGTDGRYYKAGYAPLRDGGGRVLAAIRVEAPAEYFDDLRSLARKLVTLGVALAGAVVLVSFLFSTLLTRPLRRLAGAAARIGRGDLAAPVPAPTGRDEIALLARTLEDMRAGLSARDERLQMMLAGIAHEVRNPLGGIRLYAGILRDELGDDLAEQAAAADQATLERGAAERPGARPPAHAERIQQQRGHVARIERELAHLEAVVGDFLEYARRPPPELAAVDLAGLAAETLEIVAADAARAGVELAQRGAAPAPVAGDARQLRRALLNLLRNAIQATPSGGRVEVALSGDGSHARIVVRDTGAGIPADKLAKIWTPFFTTKEKGTGLGLAFVKEIVDDHGGTLAVDTEPGRGTTFTLELRAWA